MPIGSLFIETAYALPLIAVCVLGSAFLAKRSRPGRVIVSVLLGAALGVAYAVAISFIAGPMVTAFAIPLLPFMTSVGECVGLVRGAENWRLRLQPLNISVFVILIALNWISFFALRHYMDSAAGSFRIVVVRRDPSLKSVQWDNSDNWVNITAAERKRVQEAIGSSDTGTLTPLSFLNIGERPKGTAILVMLQDSSQRIEFQMPDDGVAIFSQNQDGTWQENMANTHIGLNKLDRKSVV